MRLCHAKVQRCGKGYDQGTFTEVRYNASCTRMHRPAYLVLHCAAAALPLPSYCLLLPRRCRGDGLVSQ